MDLSKRAARNRRVQSEHSGDQCTPKIEMLEPRLLLDADPLGGELPGSAGTSPDEPAIIVDFSEIGGMITSDNGQVNLALGQSVVASSSYPGFAASSVTDGDASSRWSSQFTDNEWIYVDLGSSSTIQRVVLTWEAAYGRSYRIQVSEDGSTWSDVYSTSTSDGGTDDITLATAATGRYVRMLGIQRATPWGYSLFEFEIYGTVASL